MTLFRAAFLRFWTASEKCVGEPFLDILIGEYVTEEGSREYESLLFLTENYVLEAERFAVEPKLWITTYRHRIDHMSFQSKDYDLKVASSSSRVNFRCEWASSDFELVYRASGSNCDHLRTFALHHILPNLVDGYTMGKLEGPRR